MSECKAQLKDLQDATTAATAHPEASSQAKRHRRHRHRSRHRLQSSPRLPPQPYNAAPAPPNVELAAKAAAAAAGNQSATGKPESRTQQQKQAVNTIEDYILGARNARRAKDALSSLRQLHMVEQELDAIRKQYNRQLSDMQLSFVADKSGNLRLAFNRDNAPFLAYQDVLQKLLFKLDEIPSHGDEVVRAKRKAVVVKIQDTLDALDQFAADQESEITGSSATEGVLADESSNGDF
ncbi:hypothetical protein GGI02_003333 [Coemansia sp. RSA 2322]|nr:hypothetical protein GGI02_003333 [Coemansia sp. RSA 2322]